MKNVGGVLLYGLPLSLSIITPHIKARVQVSLESGFIEKPMEHKGSRETGEREERSHLYFFFF